MKLKDLHEENIQGVGLRNMLGIEHSIADAMQLKRFHSKRKLRTPKARMGTGPGIPSLKGRPGVPLYPAVKSGRYRRYFGILPPNVPY